MTEQEAETFAVRLTRVWAALRPPSATRSGPFSYHGQLACDKISVTYLDVDESLLHPGTYRFVIQRLWGGNGKGLGQIAYNPDENEIEVYTRLEQEDKQAYAQFAGQWMDVFRRNCWLSGCPIEATAHEKAEWMQGFSREEVESWDLKM